MSIRITQQSISASTLRGLQSNLSRMQDLQAQLSSGKRISVASDDPSGAASAMTFRSQQAADEQYLRNIDQVSARLGVTDNTLTALSDRLRAVRDLLVQAGNAGLGADSRSALAAQAASMKSEVVDLYNTTYLDRPVFGGHRARPAGGRPVHGAYVGNDESVSRGSRATRRSASTSRAPRSPRTRFRRCSTGSSPTWGPRRPSRCGPQRPRRDALEDHAGAGRRGRTRRPGGRHQGQRRLAPARPGGPYQPERGRRPPSGDHEPAVTAGGVPVGPGRVGEDSNTWSCLRSVARIAAPRRKPPA